jgi:hypothetical protein
MIGEVFIKLWRKYAFTICVSVVAILHLFLAWLVGFTPHYADTGFSDPLAPLRDNALLTVSNILLLQFVGAINYFLTPLDGFGFSFLGYTPLMIFPIAFFLLVYLIKILVIISILIAIQWKLNNLYPNSIPKTLFFGFLTLLALNYIAELVFHDSLSIKLMTQCLEFSRCFNTVL